jgi:hypothetical protein
MTLLLLAALCAWVAPGAPRASGEERNLLVNGGFEDGVAGWNVVDMAGATRIDVDDKVKADGKASLLIERDAPGGRGFVKQYVELPPTEKPLRLRLRYRVDKKSDLAAKLYFYDAAGKPVGNGPAQVFQSGRTKSFERVDEELEVPEGATRVGLEVSITSGRAWLDAVELRADVAPGLPDPGFEASEPLWKSDGEVELLRVANDRKRRSQGKSSLRIERTSPRLRPEVGVVGESRVATSAKRARLTIATLAEEGARSFVVMQAFDARGRCLASARVAATDRGDSFADTLVDLELPPDASFVRVSLLVGGTGSAWFDDARLEVQ